MTNNEQYHLFAWQGFACEVPVEWNLAGYAVTDGIASVRLHDDFGLRLEFEWRASRPALKTEIIRRRSAKIAAAMIAAGAQAENIADLPAEWSACLYSRPDGKRLLTAFRLAAENNFFGLLKIHFDNASSRAADRIVRRLAASFKLYGAGLAPWAFYDVAFQLRSDFKLVATSLRAGRKLLVFERQLRRLYLFFFSCADLLLQKQPLEKYCAGYLNGFKALAGVKFAAGENGGITSRRQWRRFWGNVEPLVRGCLRYQAWCRLLPERNQIFLGAFNYRRPADLAWLASDLDASLAYSASLSAEL